MLSYCLRWVTDQREISTKKKKKKGTPKHEHFSSSLWLSSSEGPCAPSGNGESGNIPGSAGPEEIVWLRFDEVSWMKNYDYSTTDDEDTLSILPWLEWLRGISTRMEIRQVGSWYCFDRIGPHDLGLDTTLVWKGESRTLAFKFSDHDLVKSKHFISPLRK